jgi:CheY-like chemotaxis protein
MMAGMIREWGLRCEAARSGSEALEKIASASNNNTPFGLVLLDCRLSDRTGLEVARQIRTDNRVSHKPSVILLSSEDKPDLSDENHELGIQSFLTKPIRRGDLCRALEIVMGVPVSAESKAMPAFLPFPHVSPGRRLHVLIVEDNDISRMVAVALVKKIGHSPHEAADGAQAIEMYEKLHPDIILMDVQMAGIDGYEATRRIRNIERLREKRVTILALTAHAFRDELQKCIDAGMDHYLVKPVRPETLAVMLEKYAGIQAEQLSVVTPQALPGVKIEGIDMKELSHRFLNDPAMLKQVFSTFMQTFPLQIAAMKEALASGNYPALKDAGHTIKGSTATVSAAKLSKYGELIEQAALQKDTGATAKLIALVESEFEKISSGIRPVLERLGEKARL